MYEGAWPVRYSDRTAGILAVDTREGNRQEFQGRLTASASNAGGLFEGPLGKKQSGSRGSWIVSFRKSYLDYILNRIDFGDQPPLAFGFTDGEARLTYDLTSKHTISLSDVEGASGVDRTAFQSELGPNTVMTSGFRFSLLNLGSRYAPNERVLITNHLAWSRERGDVANRDNALLNHQAYGEWTWHGDVSVSWLPGKPGDEHAGFRRPVPPTAAGRFHAPVRLHAGEGAVAGCLPRHGTPDRRLCAAILRLRFRPHPSDGGCAPGRI